jgi:hypothetical protein
MRIKWTPEDVLDDEGNDIGQHFSGHVIIEVKPKIERLKIAQELRLSVKGGEVDVSAIDKLAKMDDILQDAVKEVKLKTTNGYDLKSLDDLESFAEGVQLSQHLLGIAINGLSLGKPLKPKSEQPSDT